MLNATQDRTMPGTMVGTPSYMSPEQILGQPVGSRTDIFAAGVVLYQFVTGRQPFEGQGMFDVQRRIHQIRDNLVRYHDPATGGTGLGNYQSTIAGAWPDLGLGQDTSFM